ncbi:TPA: phage tail protein [Aeromonas salmonicida subsp. masoucida]
MSQVITNAFEQYWQSSLAAEQPVVLDEFILADIPNLDITSPIDPDTGLPPESQIVHRQNVDQRGRINNNAVAYTIVMDTTVGDFSFNAMYLRNKQNGVIGMIVYKGRETKLKTDQTTGQTGNSLVKSMLMGYDQAAEATLTNVDAGTWQIDYAARLRGQDEDLRQLASQLYGHHTFIGDGFKVVQQDGGHQVTQGVAIVGGLRIEMKQPEVIHPGTKPIGVWVDVHRSGSLLSEHQNHFTIITSVADLADHVDESGYQHYVAKLGTVQADSTVIDGRGQGGSGGSGAIPDTFALWKRSMAEAGYDLIGQLGTKHTIETAKQVLLSKDGTAVYAWSGEFPKDVDENETPENSGGIVPSAWLDKTDDVLRNQLETTNGATLVKTKAGQSIQQILDYTYYFNALEPNPNGVADNAALFVKADAEAMGRAIFISGNGVYFSTYTPLSPLITNGTVSIKIGVKEYRISSIPQKLSQLEQVEVDGEVVRMSNLCAGQDSAPHMVDSSESYANTLYGTSSGSKVKDNVKRLTGFGGFVARDLKKGYSLDLFGTNSAQWTNFADRLTLVGANSGKNIGSENPVGRHAYFNPLDPDPNGWDTRWPEWRQFAGAVNAPAQVMTEADFGLKATHVVGIGRNTFGFSITTKDSVGAGYDTCTSLLYGQDVVGIGDRVMQWTIKGDFCTWGGSKAARSVMESYQDTGWGCLAGANYVRMRRNTISGYQVMAGFLCNLTDIPESNCFYGRISAANAKGSIKWNCGFGENTLTYVQSNGNTCSGQNALSKLSDPLKGNNTASGMDSMVSMQDLTPCTSVENSSGFGYQARVSGDNQVQLGNSATTTYVFGTVQNRSDARDKTDVVNTKLGINFIMGLRPVDGRWDMRDDYVEAYQAQIGIDDEAQPIFETRYRKLPKDGSKARQRLHHWFIAQEVKELCDELGVEFGGYQDHKVLGGSDVLTLGYDEFIPPAVRAIQECWQRIDKVEERISKLENGG